MQILSGITPFLVVFFSLAAIATLLVAAYIVAIWAMGAKPT